MSDFALLQPTYLLGLAGVAVPIVIHLYGRRRRREVAFPSLQLLKATQQRQRSLVRLRRLLVLLLRILAIAFFVLALARPTARNVQWASAVAPAPASVAIVLDDSLSMGLRIGDETAFERARTAVNAILRALRGGDDAVIALTSGRSALLPAKLTGHVGALRGVLPRLRESETAIGLGPAIARARELLADSGRPTRHVYVITDLQAAAWEDVRVSREAAHSTPTATVVDVGAAEPENWAIEGVSVASPIALVDRPVRLRADIRRHGGRARRRVTASLVEGEASPAIPRTIALEPNAAGSVEFVHRPRIAGDGGISIRLQSDSLPQDNQRFVVLRVRDRLDVLCVEGTPGATRFLRHALQPEVGAPSEAGASVSRPGAISTSVARAGDLSQTALSGADVVVLANVARLGRDPADALIEYVRGGGGLLVFLGDRVDAKFYNELLWPQLFGAPRAVALARIVGDAAERSSSFAIGDFSTTRPPLAAFAEPSAGDLTTIHFFALWEIRIDAAHATSPLARFDNGLPAMLDAVCGAGRAVVVNTTADDAWTDAPRKAVYVPLMHRLCHHLARGGRSAPTSVLVGDDVAAFPGAPGVGELKLYDQAGNELTRAVVGSAGVYRAVWGPEGQSKSTLVAANIDPAESNTERISARAAAAKLEPVKARVVLGQELPALLRGGIPRAVDFSLPLLLLAIAALAAELLLSARPRLRRRTTR